MGSIELIWGDCAVRMSHGAVLAVAIAYVCSRQPIVQGVLLVCERWLARRKGA